MKITVANPIYDSVFKFLMEDERIAKTVMSALIKKEVVRKARKIPELEFLAGFLSVSGVL